MTQGFGFELKRSSIGNDKEKLDRVLNSKSATKFMQTIDEVLCDSLEDDAVRKAAKTIYNEFGFAEYVTDNNEPFEKYAEFVMYLSYVL